MNLPFLPVREGAQLRRAVAEDLPFAFSMPTTVKTSRRSTYHDSLLFMAVLHRSFRPLRRLERPAPPSQTKKKSLEKLRKECAVMMTHSFEKNYHTRRKADTE